MSIENYDMSGCTLNSQPQESMRGYIDGSVERGNGMPVKASPDQVAYFRKNPIYKKRERQLTINLLGLAGGRPYVNARLSRYSAESEIDWIGGSRPDGSESTGRLQQTHAFPYLGRIASKQNQYVFQTQPIREGADPEVLKDITRDGRSVNDIMRKASDIALACKWCWIGVNAPKVKENGQKFTVAEKEQQNIRPYWNVYSPLDVLDWHFNERGKLQWIKTRGIEYDDSDPKSLPAPRHVVTLWEIGKITKYWRVKNTGARVNIESEEIPISLQTEIPFVLVGDIDAEPIAFDDLEAINRTILDLGSVTRANFFNCSYPQLVIPDGLIQRMVSEQFVANPTEAAALVIGRKFPIQVAKDDADPKYLMPDASAMAGGPALIAQMKRELFEVVGMALEPDSKQVASAASKEWDSLDVSAVMVARAEMLEDAENKAVEMSKAWDSSFQGWTAIYNREFDIGDFKAEVEALVMAGNMSMPDGVSRELVKKLVDRLDRIGSKIEAETMTALIAEIDAWKPNDYSAPDLAFPTP